MEPNNLKRELINYIVKGTQHVIMIDRKMLLPLSGGSGGLIIYKDRLFFVSVQHVTDLAGKQAALDTGITNNNEAQLFSLPALHFVDEYNIEDLNLNPLEISKLRTLDICYTEITGSLEIKQQEKKFNDIVVSADSKIMVYTNLDNEPTKNQGYSFYGRIGGTIKGNTLEQTDKLVLGMKYDRKIGPFERFILNDPILNELDFKGTSGAPIFSETGEPVAFVAHGFIGQNYIYGFSGRELKKYLDIYIDQHTPLNDINADDSNYEYGDPEQLLNNIDEPYSHFDGNPAEDISERPDSGNMKDFNKVSSQQRIFSDTFNFSKAEEKHIKYPVFYGTNRMCIEHEKISFNNKRDYKLHLGCCDVSIPCKHKVGNIERPNWFSKLLFDDSPDKHFMILANRKTDELTFKNLIKEQIGLSAEKDVLLFVHGFNVEFDEAMMRTAQLGYDLNFKGAVTCFSWPSDGSIAGYVADTDSSRLSADYLSTFIKQLITDTGAAKLHIIAHSMGNVALTSALMQLKQEGFFPNTLFNQIILAAPDIDRDIFINQIMPSIKRDANITLYASDNDKALIAAKKIRKGYTRLGEAGQNIIIIKGLDSVDASNVKTDLLGHGYFSGTMSLINDIHLVLSGVPPHKRILDEKNKVINGNSEKYWAFKRN